LIYAKNTANIDYSWILIVTDSFQRRVKISKKDKKKMNSGKKIQKN